jgi:hypothetical protein
VKRWHVIAVVCALIAIVAYLAMIIGPHVIFAHAGRKHG